MVEKSDAFYELIWPHAAMLLRVAQTLCRNDSDAEDLVQETLLKAYRHLDQFAQGTNIRSWLLAILRNTRIDRVRAGASRKDQLSLDQMIEEAGEPAAAAPTPAGNEPLRGDPRALLEALGDQELIRALLDVTEEIRWTLLLVDVEGLEMTEAAAVMGIPAGTVKSRLHRGRGMLREILEPVMAQRSGRDRGER